MAPLLARRTATTHVCCVRQHPVCAVQALWVSGSSRAQTYGSVEHAVFQPLADWYSLPMKPAPAVMLSIIPR